MNRDHVKGIRLELGLSQERFAHLLQVSLQSVRRWENGVARPLPFIVTRLEEIARELEAVRSTGSGQARSTGSGQARSTGSGQARSADSGQAHSTGSGQARSTGSGQARSAGSGQAQHTERGIPMGESEKEEARRSEFAFSGMFKGIGNLLDLVSRMGEEGREQRSRTGTFETPGGDARGVYGFSVRLGLGGTPVVEEFGNIRETGTGPVVGEAREPLVDTMDEGDTLVVIAEMPGVEEGDISVDADGDRVEIRAATGQRKYEKGVDLPARVSGDQVESRYKNGILEVRLKKV